MTNEPLPTRAAGLERLAAFLPHAGSSYARERNYDRPGHIHVSRLSPYLRRRLITEEEVLRAVIDTHGPRDAQKFIAEIFWRTYFKGWLELRPSIWSDYQSGVLAALNRIQTESGLRKEWESACNGTTGIDGFDHWAKELTETGYLHNHARMWFASIWIFTLRLPWELGADFFLRHLLDGDPASNTLSWRWVAGLHTRGKAYIAASENIARFTDGRFHPKGLAENPAPLDGPAPPSPRALPALAPPDPTKRSGLLLHEDDLAGLAPDLPIIATAALLSGAPRAPLQPHPRIELFNIAAAQDALGRQTTPTTIVTAATLQDWIDTNQLQQIITPYAPTGRTARTLATLKHAPIQVRRPYDSRAWPHATHGFFRFKEQIPSLLAVL